MELNTSLKILFEWERLHSLYRDFFLIFFVEGGKRSLNLIVLYVISLGVDLHMFILPLVLPLVLALNILGPQPYIFGFINFEPSDGYLFVFYLLLVILFLFCHHLFLTGNNMGSPKLGSLLKLISRLRFWCYHLPSSEVEYLWICMFR